jgi:hypothetical protein
LVPEKPGNNYGKWIGYQQIFWNVQDNFSILPSVMAVEILGYGFAQSHGRAKINPASTGCDRPVGFHNSEAAAIENIFDCCG